MKAAPARRAPAGTNANTLPPGPRRPALLQTLDWARRPVALLEECKRRYGRRFTLRFVGGRSYLVLADPADVRKVFTAPPDVLLSGRANQAFATFVGPHSLFVLDGPPHRRHRRLISPPLRGERLRAYGALIRRLTVEAVRAWTPAGRFPIVAPMRDLTLQVILRAVFGVVDAARARRLTELTADLSDRGTALLVFVKPLQVDLGPRSPWRRFLRLREEFVSLIRDEVVRARRDPDGREDILARMIVESRNQGDELTDDELIGELMTLLGAGHETATSALAFAFRWILGTPEVRDQVVAEALEDPQGRLPYTTAAVNESLRLTPVVPIVPRWVAEPFELEGLTVPPGSYLAPCVWLAQRDPELFSEPLRFRPERFLDKRPGPFEYFPFGGSNRLCVGNSFTLFEVPVILSTVLAEAELALPCPRIPRIGRHGITLAPTDGTPVVFERLRRGA